MRQRNNLEEANAIPGITYEYLCSISSRRASKRIGDAMRSRASGRPMLYPGSQMSTCARFQILEQANEKRTAKTRNGCHADVDVTVCIFAHLSGGHRRSANPYAETSVWDGRRCAPAEPRCHTAVAAPPRPGTQLTGTKERLAHNDFRCATGTQRLLICDWRAVCELRRPDSAA